MNSSWTPETIRDLGVTTDLPTLALIFHVSKWRSYEMAHTGEWEEVGIRITRLGTRYRVIVQSILTVLGEDTPSEVANKHAQPSSPGRSQAAADIAALEPSSRTVSGGKL